MNKRLQKTAGLTRERPFQGGYQIKHLRKRRRAKKPLTGWKYMRTSQYQDSLDRLFGKEKRWKGTWTNSGY